MAELRKELLVLISLYEKIVASLDLVEQCDRLSMHNQQMCYWFLQECKEEICRLDGSFDKPFMQKHLSKELERFAEWLVPYIPTAKMQIPLLLRTYTHEDDTDKIGAVNEHN